MRVSLPRFALAATVLVSASTAASVAGGLDAVRALTAASAWWVAGVVGLRTTLLGSEIVTASRVLDVATTCLPLGILAVLLAVVLATDTTWPRRFAGLAGAVVAMFVANVLRVVIGVWAAQSAPGVFDALHATVLQLVPMVAALGTWLLWAGRGDAA